MAKFKGVHSTGLKLGWGGFGLPSSLYISETVLSHSITNRKSYTAFVLWKSRWPWTTLKGRNAYAITGKRKVICYICYQSINQSRFLAWLKYGLLQRPRKRERWNYGKMWGNDLRNKKVLSRWRKTVKEGDDWMSSGREFQRTDTAMGNERRPTVGLLQHKLILFSCTWYQTCSNINATIKQNKTFYFIPFYCRSCVMCDKCCNFWPTVAMQRSAIVIICRLSVTRVL